MSKARILVSRFAIIVVALATTLGVYAMRATFGDTVATYSVGGIDLKVDSKAYYNSAYYPQSSWSAKDLQPYYDKFFSFADVKPGDTGTTTISLHIKKASAYMCLSFSEFKDQENSRNEPELQVDATNTLGELGKGVEFFAWTDDGDNTFEVGEKPLFGTSTQSAIQTVKNTTYALADYLHGSAWLQNSTHYVGIAWCAGNLSVDLASAKVSCDGSVLGNEAQTDILSFSVSLTAVPYTQDKKYTCAPPPPQECRPDDNDHKYPHNDYDGKDRDNDGKDKDWNDDQDDHDGKDHDKDGKDHDGEDDPEDPCEDHEAEEMCHHTGDKKYPTKIIEVEKKDVSEHKKHGDYVIEDRDDEKKCKEGKEQDDDHDEDKDEDEGRKNKKK
jgi:hypothetical protein